MKPMAGRTAIVTGSAQGIGAAIATRLAAEGCSLVLVDKDAERLRVLAASLHAETLALEVDVARTDEVAGMAAEAKARFGTVDYLVNNAAILRNSYLTRMTDDDWQIVLDVNLGGPFKCIRAVAPLMMENRFGKIVTVASGSSAGMVGQANYSASKAGVYGLTKTAALELASFGINVNAVSPGFVVTPITEQLARNAHKELDTFVTEAAEAIPLRRTGLPDDIAGAVHFLLSDDSSFMTGQILSVRGGPGPAAS